MNSKLVKIYEALKQKGLSSEQEQKILAELNYDGSHDLPEAAMPHPTACRTRYDNRR